MSAFGFKRSAATPPGVVPSVAPARPIDVAGAAKRFRLNGIGSTPTSQTPIARAPGVLPRREAPAPPPTSVMHTPDEPLAMRLKHVLDALRSDRRFFTRQELTASACLAADVEDDKELHETLRLHEHVSYEAVNGTYSYQPKTRGVNNRQQLMQYLNANTTAEGVGQMGMVGVCFSDLEDAYLSVKDDVEKLRHEGRIFVIGNLAAQDAVLFNEVNRKAESVAASLT